MLSFRDKINYLGEQLDTIHDNYADSFKTDIFLFIGDFDTSNSNLLFLKNLSSKIEINNWINKLTSRIVMRENETEINNLIFDYIEFG